MPTLSAIDYGCDRKEVTLVVHPAIMNAIKVYEDSCSIPECRERYPDPSELPSGAR